MATYTFDKIEYGSNTYVVSDSGALQLTGGQVTGPVTFGDSVTIDEATLGDLVVNGSASFTNNIQANTINGVEVGSSPKFTDTNTEVSTLTLVAGSTAGTSLTSGGKFTLTAGSKTVSFTMPTIPTVPSNIVNTITTTAGAHTAITSQKGNVSFNVPTTAAHVGAATSDHTHGNITNGGDITATAPTIASGDQIIINDNSASKITNGPTFDGSTTTTALTPKGTWETFSKFSGSYNDLTDKPTIPTNTDEKLKTIALTSATTYYPILATGANAAANRQVDSTLGGFKYVSTAGTTSVVGSAELLLGNATASGTANNEQGKITIYGTNAKKAAITLAAPSADIALALPTSGGTLALVSQIPSSTGSATTGITASTTATKTTLGTAFTIPNVTNKGSASTWTFEDVPCDDITAWSAGSGSASISGAVDSSDTTQLNITISHTHTAPSLSYTAKTASHVTGGGNGTAPTLGTAFTVPNVTGNTSATVSITDSGHTHSIS